MRTQSAGTQEHLPRFDPSTIGTVDCRVALDPAGRVAGFVTWRKYDDGHGRVLDLMRRAVDAPNPTMDLLVGESLLEFAAAGIETASLGAVPLSHGRLSKAGGSLRGSDTRTPARSNSSSAALAS